MEQKEMAKTRQIIYELKANGQPYLMGFLMFYCSTLG